METEKNNITSDNAAEEEVVFNTGKSTKSAPAKQEPEKSAAVSFGTTGKAEKAEKIEKTGKPKGENEEKKLSHWLKALFSQSFALNHIFFQIS